MPPFIMSIENMPHVFSPDPFFVIRHYTKDQCKGYSHELTLFNMYVAMLQVFSDQSALCGEDRVLWRGEGVAERLEGNNQSLLCAYWPVPSLFTTLCLMQLCHDLVD